MTGVFWHVFGAIGAVADSPLPVADAPLPAETESAAALHALDWLVLAVYALSMLGVGWYCSRRTRTTDEFLLGGRNMKPWAVGLSYFAALTSTVSYLMYPGEMIKHGPMIMGFVLAYPFAYVFVGWLLIPYIMKLKVTTAYELLEMRFGISVRMLGSLFFLVLRLFWMALIIYATVDSVLVPVTGLDPASGRWLCIGLGTITVIYTSMGGLQAVIWTDVIQTFIMMAGAVLAIGVASLDLGGVSAWWPKHWQPGWDEIRWIDAAGTRVSLASAWMASFTLQVCTAASDQMAVQRCLATRDVRAARRMFGISLVTDGLVMLLLGALGLALYAYFQAHLALLPSGQTVASSADRLLPLFMVKALPTGVAGLFVAALLSAAMGSLSSGLTSSCSVLTVDWIDRFGPTRLLANDPLRTAKIVSWCLGVVVIGTSFIFTSLVSGNLLELAYKMVNLLVAPLAVLFFLAMFVPWATTLGAWIGAAASVCVAVGIGHLGLFGLSFLWLMPGSLLAGLFVGALASLVRQRRSQAVAGLQSATPSEGP